MGGLGGTAITCVIVWREVCTHSSSSNIQRRVSTVKRECCFRPFKRKSLYLPHFLQHFSWLLLAQMWWGPGISPLRFCCLSNMVIGSLLLSSSSTLSTASVTFPLTCIIYFQYLSVACGWKEETLRWVVYALSVKRWCWMCLFLYVRVVIYMSSFWCSTLRSGTHL